MNGGQHRFYVAWLGLFLLAGDDKNNYAAVVAADKKWLPKDEAPERAPKRRRDNKRNR